MPVLILNFVNLKNVNEYWISDNEYLLKETYTKNDEKLGLKFIIIMLKPIQTIQNFSKKILDLAES